jgi:hypothetical protein
MPRTARLVLLAALLLPLTACGGNEEEEKASKSISDSIMKEQEGAQGSVFTMKRGEADCIGEGFVDSIGVDKLKEYEFLDEELKAKPMTNVVMEKDDAESATNVLFDCADVEGLMNQALAGGGQMDERTQQCLDEVLTEERLKSMFTLMFAGEQEKANQEVIKPLTECAAAGMEQQPEQ